MNQESSDLLYVLVGVLPVLIGVLLGWALRKRSIRTKGDYWQD